MWGEWCTTKLFERPDHHLAKVVSDGDCRDHGNELVRQQQPSRSGLLATWACPRWLMMQAEGTRTTVRR